MKIRIKLFLFIMAFCSFSIILAVCLMVESTHKQMLEYEINALIEYDTNINDTVFDYLITAFAKNEDEKLSIIQDYLATQHINNTHFEIHNDKDRLFTTHHYDWNFQRSDLTTSKTQGKNYILVKESPNHFILLSHPIIINKTTYHLTLIKNVSFIMDSRHTQYKTFTFIMIFIILGLTILSYFLSLYITKDLGKLTAVANHIEAGNYTVRTQLESGDEIGLLGHQIDKMAQVIENNIHSLENESHVKQRFINNLTHELRSPLTSIIGYSELMLRTKYNKEIFNKSLYHIYSEGNRLTHLSQKMTEYILLNNCVLAPSEFHIEELIQDVIHISSSKYENHHIEIEQDGGDFPITSDQYLLKTILLNLVDNGIKASLKKESPTPVENDLLPSPMVNPDPINITISVSQISEGYTIVITDTSIGMTSTTLEKIYEPFYTVDSSRNSNASSIGLGMSICHDLVHLLGGAIHIESTPNIGTSVSLIFKFTTS